MTSNTLTATLEWYQQYNVFWTTTSTTCLRYCCWLLFEECAGYCCMVKDWSKVLCVIFYYCLFISFEVVAHPLLPLLFYFSTTVYILFIVHLLFTFLFSATVHFYIVRLSSAPNKCIVRLPSYRRLPSKQYG